MRLGFAVKVMGREGLKSNDARRWQNNPHLRYSIEYLHAIFDYLAETKISMYRISSDFAPYLTHPEMPQFHNQLEEARDELMALGQRARKMNLRLSFHPSQYILLNSPGEKLTQTSIRDIQAQATILDIMQQSEDAVVVTHVGGVYGARDAARARFIERFHTLPEAAKRRVVLENDDTSWGVDDVLRIHEATGIRCIFDHQHHGCINPDGRDAVDACCVVLKTWHGRGRPKIHFSSPRLEDRIIERRDKATGKRVQGTAPALASQHADYIDATVFIPFTRAVAERYGCAENEPPLDVMCEAKVKDLAVLRLRQDLQNMAPDIALS
jgi:UV DNA damage endonuclease